eukprot:2987085-Prymnesium_polylepis.1
MRDRARGTPWMQGGRRNHAVLRQLPKAVPTKLARSATATNTHCAALGRNPEERRQKAARTAARTRPAALPQASAVR